MKQLCFLIFAVLFLQGCETVSEVADITSAPFTANNEKTFNANYENAWNAVVVSLDELQLSTSIMNKENGNISTKETQISKEEVANNFGYDKFTDIERMNCESGKLKIDISLKEINENQTEIKVNPQADGYQCAGQNAGWTYAIPATQEYINKIFLKIEANLVKYQK